MRVNATPPPSAAINPRWKAGAAFFTLFLAVTVYPGVLPFNRIRPFVLGIPFILVWITVWVLLGTAVLWAIERGEGE
jgi:hypothetical protein